MAAAAFIANPAQAVVEPSPAPSTCSSSVVDRAIDPATLRRLVDTCKDKPAVALQALGKLNASPIPAELIARLRAGAGSVPVVGKKGGASQAATHVSFEVAIFFGSGETFPTNDGFRAMFQLIERVNSSGGSVKSIALVGTVDALEAETSMARSLARGRAEVLHRYFVAAGVDRKLIQAGIKTKSDSLAASPNDRAAHAVLIVELPA